MSKLLFDIKQGRLKQLKSLKVLSVVALAGAAGIALASCGGGNTAFAMPISKDPNETTTSNVFRVEKIDENCATFRVLTTNPDGTEVATIPYIATNSFFTMNLNCVCALRCLNDTYIECI